MTSNDGQSVGEHQYPEYPSGEIENLTERAVREFNARIEEHGRGKIWLQDEPRAHLLKAVDELFLARGREEHGDIDGMEEHQANAINHMAFAQEIARGEQSDG